MHTVIWGVQDESVIKKRYVFDKVSDASFACGFFSVHP